jgi:hypothetical protein
MKQYMLSVHHAEGDPTPDDATIQRMYADVEAFNTELRAGGAWVFAGGLQPPTSATVVRVKEGEALLTDGPFSESKEQLGGFWVVKAPDLDAALEIARRGAIACQGPVEVRPFQDDAED